MNGAASSSLTLRLGVFALIVVLFQVGVVSELPVFGVNADLASLLVAFVGLMCGSSAGAACGFAVGLFVDLALLRTLGLTSLILTLIGYWCGRLRELRDPQAALTPLIVGALIGGSLGDALDRRSVIIARLERIPFSRFHLHLASILAVGTFFDAFDALTRTYRAASRFTDLRALLKTADITAAMSVEALLGTDAAFAADLQALRPLIKP